MVERLLLMPGNDTELNHALEQQGAVITQGASDAHGFILHRAPARHQLETALEQNPKVAWVQLPSAGVEKYQGLIEEHPHVEWTSAKGAYAKPVGEHGLALTLAVLRQFKDRSLATSWGRRSGSTLNGRSCVVIGAGGVAAELVRLYKMFDTHVTVVRRTAENFNGADETVTFDQLDEVLQRGQVVAVAAAATPLTRYMIGTAQLEQLPAEAVVVNVARGSIIDHGALLDALTHGRIFGAGLDVTDPEPLPEGHPLWSLPNCLVTPHTADTPEIIRPLLRERIVENFVRIKRGDTPIGQVDIHHGY
ncbi:NAD(P)-dependent oxidoreductase [Brevibacterium sp. SMBL_HHYL_HB1]|uniref:NAD(P)-dependent oxidoreductase n=1 Tax=Brevibacterium sp. SMBL_HHYL_HB1 TaxID=2777556 RepID=UPI001BA72382|nr:NAD(P)-dependent oxidoreductase [Brevibacterium sp. SMBL_HHYL_HB1]QUL80657.1 hydroxyacid dehydrogenase [Brevibacterium sp. SMBL_HHYL_HB1]